MARRTGKETDDQVPQTSVLSRLLDDDPENETEPPMVRSKALRILHEDVRNDLERLLNTRLPPKSWPTEFDELDQSVIGFGLPDLSTMSFGSENGKEEIRRLIEQTIRRYETRFSSVRVELLESSDEFDRTLRFRIEAIVKAEPIPESVVFDTIVEPLTYRVALKENA